MELSDENIIRRVQHGDGEAYLCLFDRYYARIEVYARNLIPEGENAREIASETFVRAYHEIGDYRPAKAPSYLACLLRICRRLILDWNARQKAAPRSFSYETDVMDLSKKEVAQSGDRLFMEAHRDKLRAAIHLLPFQDREVILLAFEPELSREDIAFALNKPSVDAVTSHFVRAMQKLEAMLYEGDSLALV